MPHAAAIRSVALLRHRATAHWTNLSPKWRSSLRDALVRDAEKNAPAFPDGKTCRPRPTAL